ncbi:DUF5681 domain-containing protein [Bradyrhizobium sp. CCGUVB1N3]|uniref:DUF5681 domain-containing protein n=1 Tax=Bradyrhizobium sp. CCGUVB1N3 TaxID=2949629 RepID=UPI0020B2CC01|nr:DUF5681 domain-containing protein [Bradyrhizobium sp. CCGUVB1N3]MCP3472116.1 DUF5681 domain-containing protein [Bradyrhizobium sp. CCGUVB1N3]
MSHKSGKGAGYGKPPLHTRFKPGQSGNPRGRPKGSLNFATDLKNTLSSPITLNEGGKSRRVTTQKAALLRLREQALKGNVKALDKLLSYAMAMSGGAAEDSAKSPSVEDQAILDAFRAQILAEARDDEEEGGP